MNTSSSSPQVRREFRGVWVATVTNIDWPSAKGLSTAQQKAELISILDRVVSLNMNAVVFQVRPHCDALYDSKLEPWSEYLTGRQGTPPNPYYDPLQFAIDEAHQRGLELHAWFNPYRAQHSMAKTLAPNHISKTNPDIVKKYGSFLWLDPSEPATQDHSINVILDVTRRYDIDGVHIDDYFYPYKSYGNGAEFPDDASWKRYQQSGGKLSRGDWRRDNVNKFVERMYASVKKEKPWVKVGISPFGIYRPEHPKGVQGMDQYTELYADARLWLNKGWVDYWTPQLYWTLDAPQQPYKTILQWWVGENKMKRHVWAGNGAHRLVEGNPTWAATELVSQVSAGRTISGSSGNIFFSMKQIMQNAKKIADALRDGVYRRGAVIPASPWLDSAKPPSPTVSHQVAGGSLTVRWETAPPDTYWIGVYRKVAGEWDVDIVPASQRQASVPLVEGGARVEAVAVAAFTRAWNESPSVAIPLSGTAAQ